MENYELFHENGEWKLRRQGAERAIRKFDNKAEGLEFTQDYMREHEGSVKIKKLNGRIQEERTYPRSADPRRTRG